MLAPKLSSACNSDIPHYEPLAERPTTIVAGPNLVDCPRRAMTFSVGLFADGTDAVTVTGITRPGHDGRVI